MQKKLKEWINDDHVENVCVALDDFCNRFEEKLLELSGREKN